MGGYLSSFTATKHDMRPPSSAGIDCRRQQGCPASNVAAFR